jgi:hypothetical protein
MRGGGDPAECLGEERGVFGLASPTIRECASTGRGREWEAASLRVSRQMAASTAEGGGSARDGPVYA